jgi:hypothetical protein
MRASKNNKFYEFSEHLKAEGWCFLANERYTTTRLHNRYSKSTPPESVLTIKFKQWDSDDTSAVGLTEYLRFALPTVSGSVFEPNKGSFVSLYGSEWCNTYQSFTSTQMPASDLTLFLEFIQRLFPHPDERIVCLQWLAHIIQHPEQRPSWHLMLVSEVGTGKGFLIESILKPMLRHVATVSSYSEITEKFSTLMECNLLILLDDPKSKSDSTMTMMKSKLSEPTVFITHKNMEGRMVNTYARFILASNEDRPLKLDADERRWYAPTKLVHKIDRAETQRFVTELAKWLVEPGSIEGVYEWLIEYDLTGFDPKYVPQSAQLRKMIDLSRNPMDDFFEEFLEENPVFRYVDIHDAATEAGYRNTSSAYIKFELSKAGYESRRVPLNGKKPYYWRRSGMDNNAVKQLIPCGEF